MSSGKLSLPSLYGLCTGSRIVRETQSLQSKNFGQINYRVQLKQESWNMHKLQNVAANLLLEVSQINALAAWLF